MRALTARLRRLELARHAAVTARPTAEELRHYVATGEGREAVASLHTAMVEYGKRLDPWFGVDLSENKL